VLAGAWKSLHLLVESLISESSLSDPNHENSLGSKAESVWFLEDYSST